MPERDHDATPDIEVHGAIDLSLEDLAEYESQPPPSDPICDLSAVVASVEAPRAGRS